MKKTKRGRIFALVMAIVTVFSLIPILGSRVQAAGNSANDTIKGILGHDDYVPQTSRYRQRSGSAGNYTYSRPRGICTWCAFTNLLNRRVALDMGSKNLYEANKFDLLGIASRLAEVDPDVSFNKSEAYISADKKYIWVGNAESIDDTYNTTFTAKGGRSYTGKIVNLSGAVNTKKQALKDALDDNPEGIVIQFTKDENNKHGIVLTGYYYKEDKTGNLDYLSFYTVDTAGTYGDGLTKIEDAYIGNHYDNGRNVNTIVQSTKYYVCLGKGSTGSLRIDNLSIDGKTNPIVLVKGKSANLMGTVSSGVNVTSVNAVIKNEYGSTVYNSTIYPQAKSVNLKSSALNTGSNCIKFGTLAVGDYTLTITAKDAAGKSVTKTLPFTIAIKIDLSSFNGNLTYGKSYSIPGTIISAENISKIYARVVNGEDQYQSTATYRPGHAKAGKKVECTVTGVNAKNFNIKSSAIDNNLSMGGLRQGNYYFEVTVTDVSGHVRTVRKAFSVR